MLIRQHIRTQLINRLPAAMRVFVEREYTGLRLPYERRLLQSLCDRSQNAVDIGANQGDIALLLSEYCLHVHAFEPIRSMADRMRHRLRSTNVTVYDCALGAVSGHGTLHVPSFGHSVYTTRATLLEDLDGIQVRGEQLTKAETIRVQVDKLDSFALRSVGFIKIDVEGFELDVLHGAQATIRSNRPVIYVEIEQRRHPGMRIETIFESIIALGYAGWYVQLSGLHDIAGFNVETMQNPDHADTPAFLNNFVFTPLGWRGGVRTKIMSPQSQ